MFGWAKKKIKEVKATNMSIEISHYSPAMVWEVEVTAHLKNGTTLSFPSQTNNLNEWMLKNWANEGWIRHGMNRHPFSELDKISEKSLQVQRHIKHSRTASSSELPFKIGDIVTTNDGKVTIEIIEFIKWCAYGKVIKTTSPYIQQNYIDKPDKWIIMFEEDAIRSVRKPAELQGDELRLKDLLFG